MARGEGLTGYDDVDGELDGLVGPRGGDRDVVPRVLLGEEVERAAGAVGVLQAVSTPVINVRFQVTYLFRSLRSF